MNNYESISSLISSFSGQERHFAIPRVYVELVSDFNTAILLNQIVFWSDKSKRKDGYFYKSYVEWEEETTLTEYQVRRSSKVLKDMGLVETVLKKANGSPTLHYKVNMDKLSESILKKLKNRNLRNLRIDTKETEETLTVDDTVDDNSRKRSIEKKEENKLYTRVIDHLNLAAGTRYKPSSKATQRVISARINEGFTVEDMIKVIDIKADDWKGTEFEKYLRPETLFGTKFEGYLNSRKAEEKPKVQFLNIGDDE